MQDIMLRFIAILLIRLKFWKSLSRDCSAHIIRYKLDTVHTTRVPVNTGSVCRALNEFTNVFSSAKLLIGSRHYDPQSNVVGTKV